MTQQYILKKDFIHPKTKNVYYATTAPTDKEHLSYELLELLNQDPSYFLIINTLDPTHKLVEEVVQTNTSIITKKINSSEHEIQATATIVKTNINIATFEQLKSIPNITTTIAQKIMDLRPFKSIDELKEKIPLPAGKNWETYPIFLDEPKSSNQNTESKTTK